MIKLHPAVNAAILNEKGEILLTERSAHIREPGKWCLPGGHFDAGEDWQTALRREVNEEVGLIVTEEKLVGIYSDPKVTIPDEPMADGSRGQFLVALFLVTQFKGNVTPNHEVGKWGWFKRGELPSPIIKSHPLRIEDVFQFTGTAFVR
jgi:ADP-ribose pyrophosphatase YjhB (NUDIX family)